MSHSKIVLVTGRARSGKDTFVDFALQRLQTQDFISSYVASHGIIPAGEKFSFATPLKKFLMEVFDLTYEQCYGTTEQKSSPTKIKWKDLPFGSIDLHKIYFSLKNNLPEHWPSEYLSSRELMQVWGTEVCRGTYPDCWANATLKEILKRRSNTIAFVADARFPNELEVFKPYNPIIIRFNRKINNDTHLSETALDNFPFTDFTHFINIENQELTLQEKNELCFEQLKEKLIG